jgi:hypothetical protein
MEQYFNDYGTTLVGDITSVQTTLVVASSTFFPGSGNFRIRLDNELMLVTAVSGTTWTVTRGIESSGATAHFNGASINHFITAGGLAQIISEAGGTASITWAGAWAVGTGYALNNAVSYSGSSYISLQNSNTGNQPNTSPTYWALIAQQGSPGSLALKVNGTANASQTTLNLQNGANITITDAGSGNVTIASSGGGGIVTTVAASRPSASSYNGFIYVPSDGGLVQTSNGTIWSSLPLTGFQCVAPPAASTFTTANFGGGFARTLVDDSYSNSLIMTETGTGSTAEVNGVAMIAYPSAPFTLTIGMQVLSNVGVGYTYAGLTIRNSSTGGFFTAPAYAWVGSSGPQLIGFHWSALNGGGTAVYSNPIFNNVGKLFYRFRDDGTYRYAEISDDGYWWGPAFNASNWSNTDFITPNQIGLLSGQSVNSVVNGIVRARYRIFHWSVVNHA